MLLHFSSLCTKIWKRPYNAEMKCFSVLHRFTPKCRKVYTMLRSAAAKFIIGPRARHWYNHCFSRKTYSFPYHWDFGKSMIFNKKITIYFQNKNKWQIAPDLHKKSENVTLQETMRMFFFDCCCCCCCC